MSVSLQKKKYCPGKINAYFFALKLPMYQGIVASGQAAKAFSSDTNISVYFFTQTGK